MSQNTLVIDCAQRRGPVRPLHGMNLGPCLYNSSIPRADTTDRLRALRVPLVRLHDAPLQNPGMKLVDVPCVFPDFSADESDPRSYDFRETDDYLHHVLSTGCRICYRLGNSIEHSVRTYRNVPPPDFEKWGRICANIIRHYCEGWADGFTHDIPYWEIWNEPDLGRKTWDAPFELFFDLYAVVAPMLKAEFPDRLIGGPGMSSGPCDRSRQFLEACRDRDLPLDFFSWHLYASSVDWLFQAPVAVRQMLDSFGFQETESHLNEWRYVSFDWKTLAADSDYAQRHFAFMDGCAGAAATVAALLAWQDAPLAAANYYHAGHGLWGLFDAWGKSKITYHAFVTFERYASAGCRLACNQSHHSSVRCGAALDESTGRVVLLFANTGIDRVRETIELRGRRDSAPLIADVRTVDLCHDTLARSDRIDTDPASGFALNLSPLSVTLVELLPR